MNRKPSNEARRQIMGRLERALGSVSGTAVAPTTYPEAPSWSTEEKIERLKNLMEAVKTDVHRVAVSDWVDTVIEIARAKKVNHLLYGPDGPLASILEGAQKERPGLIPFSTDIEKFKETLFEMDAGITSTVGAIADTGAIVVWPTPAEPRTLSLVPHTHFAIVEAGNIYTSMSELMTRQNWAAQIPANALFISGPSKTADIEFTLAFGVHGPKELVVLIVEP